MINLLPHKTKQSYTYARRNIALRGWVTGLTVAILVQAGLVVAGIFYINQTTDALVKQNETGQAQLKAQKLEETQASLTEIGDSLKLVNQVLGKQVIFSELLRQVGANMPEGAVLTDLSIGKVSGGLDIKAATVNQATATQVQVNLQDPTNKIFDKVDIISISCADSAYGDKYFCTVQLRASFSKCNQFLLISSQCNTAGKPAEVSKP